MKDVIGYDSRKNLKDGIKSLFQYQFYYPIRLLLYASIIFEIVFNYHIFGFLFKTIDSANSSFILILLIIIIPSTIHMIKEARKKSKLESTEKRFSIANIYLIITLIICTELVFFAIHWVVMARHESKLPFPDVDNLVSIAWIVDIFWLPFLEIITFRSKELREWVCGRDRHLDDLEMQLGYK